MPVTVEIEFTGLCLFGIPITARPATVFLPDCRLNGDGTHIPHQPTAGTPPVEPHSGYIRWDLADVESNGLGIPHGDPHDGPRYAVVHRFSGDTLTLRPDVADLGPESKPQTNGFDVPDFREIAQDAGAPGASLLRVKQNLGAPELLMRMNLDRGSLYAPGGEGWLFPGTFRADGLPFEADYADYAVWTRAYTNARVVTLEIASGGGQALAIPLRPAAADGIVRLTIANLCCTNPLDWPELPQNVVESVDHDFALLYKLLERRDGAPLTALPTPYRPAGHAGFGVEGCLPGQIPT